MDPLQFKLQEKITNNSKHLNENGRKREKDKGIQFNFGNIGKKLKVHSYYLNSIPVGGGMESPQTYTYQTKIAQPGQG